MMKAKGMLGGRNVLILGLTFENLRRLEAQALDSYINIEGKEVGLPLDIIIVAGKDEAALLEMVSHAITPDTKINIDDKLKS